MNLDPASGDRPARKRNGTPLRAAPFHRTVTVNETVRQLSNEPTRRHVNGRSLWVLGVGLVDDTSAGAVETLREMVDDRRSRSDFFANAHTLNLAAADPSYRDVLNGADVVFGDGTGVLLAGLLRGVRRQDNLVGTDLVPTYLRATSCGEPGAGRRCFLLGLDPSSIDRAAAHFREEFPGWQLVGHHHGYLGRRASRDVVRTINERGTELLLVGMGNPTQERWIDAYIDDLAGVTCVAVGGLLDYWAENLPRAPEWIRRIGFEWLYIMGRQPKKVPRYVLGNPLFLSRAVRAVPADLYRRASRYGAS